MLSRISWPDFPFDKVLDRLAVASASGTIKRVCIQALNYPEANMHLQAILKAIKQRTQTPMSISCQPQNSENIKALAEAGA
ncbi:MAG: radical SAM protein, partial [Chloroflexota bacterium]